MRCRCPLVGEAGFHIGSLAARGPVNGQMECGADFSMFRLLQSASAPPWDSLALLEAPNRIGHLTIRPWELALGPTMMGYHFREIAIDSGEADREIFLVFWRCIQGTRRLEIASRRAARQGGMFSGCNGCWGTAEVGTRPVRRPPMWRFLYPMPRASYRLLQPRVWINGSASAMGDDW